MLNWRDNCSVPENNVLKCSGIYRAVPWNNDNRFKEAIKQLVKE